MMTLKQAATTHCQKCNLQLFSSCFMVFAFFKPLLREETRRLESLPVHAPRDAFIFLILDARGERLEREEFTGLLVLRLLAHHTGNTCLF